MWNHHVVSTLTEELIDVSQAHGVEVKLDDLDPDKSVAIVVIPARANILSIQELAPDGLEITMGVEGCEVTLVLPFSELDLHNALDLWLRDLTAP